jgi:hypothetical protein
MARSTSRRVSRKASQNRARQRRVAAAALSGSNGFSGDLSSVGVALIEP